MADNINYNELFSPDVLAGIKLLNTETAKLNTNLTTLISTTKKGKGSGKTYTENAEAIEKNNAVLKAQIQINKERIKLTKAAEKATEKQTQTEKELLNLSQKISIAKGKLNRQKKEEKDATIAVSRVIELQKQKLKELLKTHDKASSTYLKEKKVLTDLKTEQKKYSKELAQNKRIVASADNSLEKMRLELVKLKKEYSEVGIAAANKMVPQINKLTNAINRQERQIGVHQRNVGNYKAAFGKFSGVMSSFGLQLGAVGAAMGALKIGKEAFNTIKDFELAMSKVAAISGATNEELLELENTAKDLGRATTFTASDVANLEIELSKLGFTAKDINEVTEGILNLAQATGEDLPKTAEVAGATLRAFQLEASEMGRLTDVMALSFSSSALDLEKFSVAMRTVAPVAKTFGFSVEETTSLLAQLTNAGFDASSAGSSLRNIFLNLADPSSKLAKSLSEPVKDLPSLVRGLNELKDSGIDLAGTLQLTDKRSVAAFNQFLATGDAALMLSEDLQQAEGTAAEMSATMTNNLEGATKRLQSAWEGLILGVQAGEGEMGKGVVQIIDLAGEILNLMTDTNFLGEAFEELIAPFVELFSAFSEFGDLINMISGVSDEAGDKVSQFSFVLDVLVFAVKSAIAPTLLIAKIIGTVIKVISRMGKLVAPEMAKIREVFIKVRDILVKFGDAIKELFEKSLRKLVDVIKFNLAPVLDGLKKLFTNLLKPISFGIDLMGKFADSVLDVDDSINITIKSMDDFIAQQIKLLNLIDKNGVLKSFYQTYVNTTQGMLDEVSEGIKEAEQNQIESLNKTQDEIDKINKEKQDAINKANEEKRKKEIADAKALLDEKNKLNQLYLDTLKDGLNKEILTEKARYEQQQEEFKDNKEALEYIDLTHKHNLDKIAYKYEQEELTRQKEIDDAELLRLKELNDAKLAEEKAASENAKKIQAEQYAQMTKNIEDFAGAFFNYQKEIAQLRQKNVADEISKNDEAISNTEQRIADEQALGEKADQNKIQMLQETLSAEKTLKLQQEIEMAKLKKRAVLFQLAQDQAAAIGSLIAMSAANPLNATTFGAAGAIQYAIGFAQILVNFAKAFSVLKGFKKGGFTGEGLFKDETGDKVAGVVHENEFVHNKKVTKKYRNEFELLNQGISWQDISGFDTPELKANFYNQENDKLSIERNSLLKKIVPKKEFGKTKYVKSTKYGR